MPSANLIAAASLSLAAAAMATPTTAAAQAVRPHAHAAAPSAVTSVAAKANPAKVDATKAALRDLWLGHVFWVRNVVVATFTGDKAAAQVAETQVVANAQAIAGAFEPYYGAQAKEKLFALLAGHYGAVKAYLDATVAKDSAKQSAATTQLLTNAGELAGFLSGANPNLPKATVEELLQAHGGHHIAEIQQLQAKDYAAEAQTWSDMSKHMYVIADALGDAVAKQFPAKF